MGVVTRLTKKHQTTIPAKVHRALGLAAGDRVAFEIEAGVVTITKARDRRRRGPGRGGLSPSRAARAPATGNRPTRISLKWPPHRGPHFCVPGYGG